MSIFRKLGLIAVFAVASAAPSLSCAEETVWSSQNYNAAWSIYNRKFATATEALRRAFPGNESAIAGKQVQNKQTGWGVEAPRVVVHAATVDEPVRGRGEAFVAYLKKPDVHQWYKTNFGLH